MRNLDPYRVAGCALVVASASLMLAIGAYLTRALLVAGGIIR